MPITKQKQNKVLFVNLKVKNKQLKKKLKLVKILSQISTIHGTTHDAMEHHVKSRIWISLMIINLFVLVIYLVVIKERYHSDQIVTQIDSDISVGAMPFPTVNICNLNIISRRESTPIVDLLLKHNRSSEEIRFFFRDLEILRSFDKLSKFVGNYTDIMRILKKHYYNINSIMEGVHQKCENLLLYCEFNKKERDCSDIFTMILTTKGFCCGFNYDALIEEFDSFIFSEEDFEYYVDPSSGQTRNIVSTAQSGSGTGLKVVFDVESNDYFPLRYSELRAGAEVLLSDPNDYPDVSVVYKYATIGKSLHLKVEPQLYISDESLRRVTPDRRGCWFHDEVLLQYTDRYSFETCTTECKVKTFYMNCGCVPYNYPYDKTRRTCELEDLVCLNNLIAHWEAREFPCLPACYTECSDKTYKISGDIVPFIPEHYPEKYISGRNVSELASLQVYFTKPTCKSYTRYLLIDVSYFIATYGGVFSLTFGASLMTIFEVSFLALSFILKKISHFLRSRKIKHK